MDLTNFGTLLNDIIYREISAIVRPLALKEIQNKYTNLNVNFIKLGDSKHIINDKLIFYTDGTRIELEEMQREYDNILNKMIYNETIKFIQKLIKKEE